MLQQLLESKDLIGISTIDAKSNLLLASLCFTLAVQRVRDDRTDASCFDVFGIRVPPLGLAQSMCTIFLKVETTADSSHEQKAFLACRTFVNKA